MSKVYFISARSSARQNRLDKVKKVSKKAGLDGLIQQQDKVAIKAHWGEPGNVAFISPPYIATVVELVKNAGGLPFITDTSTLYTGMRQNGPENLVAAAKNGFSLTSVGAPIIVADGICGLDYRSVEIPGSVVGSAKIASGIVDSDSMIVVSHVKGHMLFGFGGALKNLGMGCATPAGKQVLHSDVLPKVDPEKCESDGICVKRCPEGCIEMVKIAKNGKTKKVAQIDQLKCIGCGECTTVCPAGAIPIHWKTDASILMQKTAEYALAAVKNKRKKVGFVNLIIQVTPDCDCCNWDDNPIVADIGFLASTDPVAIDTASVDLIAKAKPLAESNAQSAQGDVIKSVHKVDYRKILQFAQDLGLGEQKYELIRV